MNHAGAGDSQAASILRQVVVGVFQACPKKNPSAFGNFCVFSLKQQQQQLQNLIALGTALIAAA